MGERRRGPLSFMDSALTKVDEKVLPGLSRRLNRARELAAPGPIRPTTVLWIIACVLSVALVVFAAVRSQPPPADGGSSPIWVGVYDGDSVPAYIRLAEARLDALASAAPREVVYALVSFTEYLTPDQVAVVLAGVEQVASVSAFARVPLPRRQTERVSLTAIRVPEDLVTAMEREAAEKQAEADRYTALAEDQPAGSLRDVYESNAEVYRAEAVAYRQRCACVFALVVRGPAARLQDLSAVEGVRAVDPAAGVDRPDEAIFRPPLPEQVDRATPPVDDALPTAGP